METRNDPVEAGPRSSLESAHQPGDATNWGIRPPVVCGEASRRVQDSYSNSLIWVAGALQPA